MTTIGDAVVAVSTVKADPDQVERFLRRNLDSGVDHLLVFLDSPNPAVREILDANPHVTAVRTGARYWNGQRPPRVSDRLRINMNFANAILATVPAVGWLVSIDSDEVACIDRDALGSYEGRGIRLSILEAVSRRIWPNDEPTLFKRPPTEAELAVLSALDVIPEADLGHYFRGHQEGKSAVRPDLTIRVKVHSASDEQGNSVVRRHPGMHVLHYESHSLDDFIRRWRDYAPTMAHLRTHRESRKLLGVALHTLYHHDALTDAQRMEMIERVFDAQVADKEETLQALGLIVPAPQHGYRPTLLPPAELDQIQWLVEALGAADKVVFNEGGTADQIAAELEAAADRLPGRRSDQAASNVRATLERFHHRQPAGS